jgi:hypothetical protein
MLIAKDIKQNAAGKTESDTEEEGRNFPPLQLLLTIYINRASKN